MPRPLGQFFITDAFTTTLGWKLSPGQLSNNAVVYVNNQSPQEFAIWGNGVDFLGTAPAWISFWKFSMPLLYSFVEFRPTMSLNPLGAPALYVNGIVFESYEPDPHWQPIAVVRQTDAARQIRAVSVPIGLAHTNAGLWQTADPNPFIFTTPQMSAAQLAAATPRMPIYLYYAQIVPATGTANVSMQFQLQAQWRDASNNPIDQPFILAHGNVWNISASQFGGWTFAPSWPFAIVGPAPAGAVKANLQIFAYSGRIQVTYTVGFWADQFNIVGDTDIGTQAIYNAALPGVNPYF